MKAGIFFTGSGPIVVLTSYASLTAPNFVEKLAAKGIGKFIAYESNESGITEIYVATLPNAGLRWAISTTGGIKPRWNTTGSELTYLDLVGTLQSVPISSVGEFKAGVPTALFPLGGIETDGANYAIARDGLRFLVLRPSSTARPNRLAVIVNWPATLHRQ